MPSEDTLSAKDRRVLAKILERIASPGSGVFVVPESHRAAVLEGLAQAERGESWTTLKWRSSGRGADYN
jgi:hypothetical protein